eukprot:EG_transcript_6914
MVSPTRSLESARARRRHCVDLDPAVGEVPPDWGQDAHLDMLQFAGLLDVLMGPWGGAERRPAALAKAPTAGLALGSPGLPRQRSISSVGITDEAPNSRFPSGESSVGPYPRGSMSSCSSTCSTPETPGSPAVPTGAPEADPPEGGEAEGEEPAAEGRREWKFPFCPEGRCGHREHWLRVRTKKKYVFFTCRQCGLSWCLYKLPGFTGGPKVRRGSNNSNNNNTPKPN